MEVHRTRQSHNSDIWATYANIDTIGNRVYLHSSINHSQHFVHSIDREIYTQKIEEAVWNIRHNYP